MGKKREFEGLEYPVKKAGNTLPSGKNRLWKSLWEMLITICKGPYRRHLCKIPFQIQDGLRQMHLPEREKIPC